MQRNDGEPGAWATGVFPLVPRALRGNDSDFDPGGVAEISRGSSAAKTPGSRSHFSIPEGSQPLGISWLAATPAGVWGLGRPIRGVCDPRLIVAIPPGSKTVEVQSFCSIL